MTHEDVTQNSHRFNINVMHSPRKENLRIAIKKMALASSGKALRGEAILNPVHVLPVE